MKKLPQIKKQTALLKIICLPLSITKQTREAVSKYSRQSLLFSGGRYKIKASLHFSKQRLAYVLKVSYL